MRTRGSLKFGGNWTMKKNLRLGAILLLAVSGAAWGQQATAPSPSPAATGPTLADTLQVIQTNVSRQGVLSWVASYHDTADGTNWSHALTFEITAMTSDPATCTINYHGKITSDGAVTANQDLKVSLHDVQDVTLTTGSQRQAKNITAAGHTTWSSTVTPNIFDLIVTVSANSQYYFIFSDEDTANRVAKAMGHAVELCGGSRGSF